jgi:glycerol-3-phosphate acyltransferase PlsY
MGRRESDLNKLYLALLGAYLLGSVPFSFLLAKLKGDVDLSTKGSGNLGGTNAIRVLGWGHGVVAGLADIAKGAVAVWIVDRQGGPEYFTALAILVVTAGHNWSLFFRGKKGGKGISTTIGGFLYYNPGLTLVALGIAVEIVLLSRLVSLASLVFVTLLPIGLIIQGSDRQSIMIAVVLAIFAFWRHRANIQRLQEGVERRLGEKT